MKEVLLDDKAFVEKICAILECIENKELENIETAAKYAYESIRNNGLLHVFSTGHSHMIVEEMFYRAGGLIPVNPILDNSLMVHEAAVSSTVNERLPGKAEEVLSKAGLRQGDTIIISSNSGINIVPVEAALFAKEKGLKVVAVTSLASARELQSRHPNGKKLSDVADVVIDNHSPAGDGVLFIPENGQQTGGSSTFSSLFIAQRIVLCIENLFLSDGLVPPIYMSANVPGGDLFNKEAIEKYKDRIKALC